MLVHGLCNTSSVRMSSRLLFLTSNCSKTKGPPPVCKLTKRYHSVQGWLELATKPRSIFCNRTVHPCTVQCSTVPSSAALYHPVQHCTIQCSTVPFSAAGSFAVLQSAVQHYTSLHCVPLCSNTRYCNALHSTLHIYLGSQHMITSFLQV